jgi:ABC-type transporter Mla maintaining outer membrane lipid asymmetry ATPase subunit MlaF
VTSLGCTAVSITHDMASARTIADELAMLDNGRIVWRGRADELDHADHPLVRAFVTGQTWHGRLRREFLYAIRAIPPSPLQLCAATGRQ